MKEDHSKPHISQMKKLVNNYLIPVNPFKNSLDNAVKLFPEMSRICNVLPKPSKEVGDMKLKPQCRMYNSRIRADSNALSPRIFNGFPSK